MAVRSAQSGSRKPEGQPTRGKTHTNRLRRVDNFVARYDAGLLRREDSDFAGAIVVDLGYGAEPYTTLEMGQRLRQVNRSLRVVGVEIDRDRVAAALPWSDSLTEFRLGGFNLPQFVRSDGAPETIRLIRAFNVLRQYDEAAVGGAWARMAQHLLQGGLLIEGTSDPLGRLWVANVLRKGADDHLISEALVFSMSFRQPFDPAAFQPVLPKNLIHHVVPGQPVHDFFMAWKRAAQATSPMRVWGQRQWFAAAAEQLKQAGWRVDTRRQWLRAGFLVLSDLNPQRPKNSTGTG